MQTTCADNEKFQDPYTTAKGETRAWVDLVELKTLWFNTGTLCNLSCSNCYIESTPRNDRLVYLSENEVVEYLEQIKNDNLKTKSIGFTGGEPFLNPEMIEILNSTLSRSFKVLVLTNAYRVLERKKDQLLQLKENFGDQLQLRVSLDHHQKEIHEEQRGEKTFDKTLLSIKWLVDCGFYVSIAGRSLVDETIEDARNQYQVLFDEYQIALKLNDKNLVIFPEMDASDFSVPEITTACWDILKKRPEQQMCASERMIVKHKGDDSPSVQACTLLAYDQQFNLGDKLANAKSRVQLNHQFCAKFCVLGGSSCSSTL